MHKKPPYGPRNIRSFDFEKGQVLAGKYEVISQLGSGWEGEVYKIKERGTGIERAAKLFFPHRNKRNRTSMVFAKKLHRLRESSIAIQYHSQENLECKGKAIKMLISEFVEGEQLSIYVAKQPGKRLQPFQAVHLLHALMCGIENIHYLGEYHGDLHPENIIVRRLGLSFELKLLDLFHWGQSSKENRDADIVGAIRVFYDALGGAKHYPKHPREIKAICCGLKKSIILKKFKTATALRFYLENQAWS